MMHVYEKTTVTFCPEEKAAFDAFMDEPVDWDVTGSPISRRGAFSERDMRVAEYGWQAHAACQAKATTKPPKEQA